MFFFLYFATSTTESFGFYWRNGLRLCLRLLTVSLRYLLRINTYEIDIWTCQPLKSLLNYETLRTFLSVLEWTKPKKTGPNYHQIASTWITSLRYLDDTR